MGGFKTAIIRVVNRTGQEPLSTARDIRIGIAIRLGPQSLFFSRKRNPCHCHGGFIETSHEPRQKREFQPTAHSSYGMPTLAVH